MENLARFRERMGNHISNSAAIEPTDTTDNFGRLRERTAHRISNSFPIEPSERVTRLQSAPRSAAARDGTAALDLVYQVAEVVKTIEDRANETERAARNLIERAVGQLELAEKRIQELEAEKRAAEASISEAHAKIQEAAEGLKLERSRVDAAENQLCQIEMRARTAEAHASETGNTLARIEEALRTQILGRRGSVSKSTAAV